MLGRIMDNGVLGLLAQSQALGTISQNIANARTVGYKASETQFQDFVLDDRTRINGDGAGVRANDRLLADRQGQITSTGVGTNAAISGKGFFLVQDVNFNQGTLAPGDAQVELTRAGDFTTDRFGHFVNSAGRALMGVPLTSGTAEPKAGSVTLDDLKLVTVSDLDAYQDPTRTIDLSVVLPSDAPVVDTPTLDNTYGITATAIDRVGTTDTDGTPYSRVAEISLRFARTGTDAATGDSTWAVYNAGAGYRDDGTAIGTANPDDPATWGAPLGTFTLDRYGARRDGGTAGSSATMPLDLGPNFEPITIDLGTAATGRGVRGGDAGEFQDGGSWQDGILMHSVTDVGISSDGYVTATFSGGQSRNLYKLMNGVVANAQGLEEVSGTAYHVTRDSGGIQLKSFGELNPFYLSERDQYDAAMLNDHVGASIASSSVEESTTAIDSEFVTMIQAQRVYSAASKIVSTADEMTQTALQLRA